MILSNVNIGTGPSVGDGDPLRTAFNTINQNFTKIQTNVNSLGTSVNSVAGRTGNVTLTTQDIIGINNYATISYVSSQIANVGGAANVLALESNVAALQADINTLYGNAGVQSSTLATLTSNAAAQAGSLTTLTANAASQAGELTTLLSNAAVQAGEIASLLSNAGSQHEAITSLQSNAAVQAGLIAGLQANIGAGSYGNSNVASYLSGYGGNILTGNLIFDDLSVQNTAYTGTQWRSNLQSNVRVKPSWLSYVPGGKNQQGTQYGFDTGGMFFTGDSDNDFAYPIQTNLHFHEQDILVVEATIYFGASSNDHGLAIFPVGTRPIWTYATDATRIAYQYSTGTPRLYGQTTQSVSGTPILSAGNYYTIRFTYDPTNTVTAEVFSGNTATGSALDSRTISEVLPAGDYRLGFDADNDSIGIKSYWTNLIVRTLTNTVVNDLEVQGQVNGNLIPSANVTYSLGDSTHQWKELWVSGNTIHIGGATLSVSGGAIQSSLPIAANVTATNITVQGTRIEFASGGYIEEAEVFDGNANPLGYYAVALNSSDDGLISMNALDSNAVATSSVIVSNVSVQLNVANSTPGGNPLVWNFDNNGIVAFPGSGSIDGSDFDIDIAAGNDGASTYGTISLITNNPNGTNTLTFNSLGELNVSTIGANDGLIKWVGNSSGDSNGYTTMVLVPDTTVEGNDQYLIIDPTAPGHIHIRAGGTQDNSSADLILGGENSHFRVDSGLDPTVYVRSNNNDWIFGTDGNLTLGKTTPHGGINRGIVWDWGLGQAALGLGAGEGSNSYIKQTENGLEIHPNQPGAMGDGDLRIRTGNVSPGGTSYDWIFNGSGSLTLPNGSSIIDTATDSIAFGGGAGATDQGASAVALGEGAGNDTQGNQAIAVGRGSGNYLQGNGAVGIGFCAGATEQGDYSVAIGFKAARGNMDNDGTPNQPANSIMINASSTPLNGDQSGLYINPVREDTANVAKAVYYNTTTKELTYANTAGGGGGGNIIENGTSNVLIANSGGPITVTAVGAAAYTWTFTTNGYLEIPDGNAEVGGFIGDIFGEGMIGIQANTADVNSYASIVSHDGQNALDADGNGVRILTDDSAQGGNSTQEWRFDRSGNLTFPDSTVQTTAWTGTVAYGNTIAIGYQTGNTSQGNNAVAIGSTAGQTSQGAKAIGIGEVAGRLNQGIESVGLGAGAGEQNQGNYAIAIGSTTAYLNQGVGAVAIGTSAGALYQGEHAIAIGTGAGAALQGNNSIILNATGSTLDQTTDDTFTVAPIRNTTGSSGVLQYNSSTSEVSYNTNVTLGNVTAGNISASGISGKIGYSSGNFVQQITSNSTQVTSHFTSGNIQLMSIDLAAHDVHTVAFACNKLTTNDMLIVKHIAGGITSVYVDAYVASDGLAVIWMRDITGVGTGAFTPMLKYAIIQAPSS